MNVPFILQKYKKKTRRTRKTSYLKKKGKNEPDKNTIRTIKKMYRKSDRKQTNRKNKESLQYD